MLFAKWMTRGALGVAMLSVVVAGGWACGGDSDALTLEEYFQELEAIDNNFSEQSDGVFENLSEDSEVSEVESALDEFAGIINDFVGEIEGLEPPDEAQDVHDAAVAAGNEASDAYDELVNAAGEAESIDAIFTSDAGLAAQESVEAFGAACLDVQQLADDNSIDVALDCGEDEGDAE